MTDQPLISIVTPSYNQAPYLEATIQSVLSQDYPHVEYIVMDGGSDDGSAAIIGKYADQLAYWVSERDGGQADALNRGFARATGDIFAWLNSDDVYEPGALRRVAETFAVHPEAALVYGEGWYIDAEGRRIRPCHFVRSSFPQKYIYNKDPILQQSAFWRRSLWRRVGPLNEELNWVFDWEWFIRASQVTDFHYIPHFLANYRVHPAAKTRSTDIQRRREQASLTRRYGGWWHPNFLVQRARIQAHQVERWSESWPGWAAKIGRRVSRWPVKTLEFLFYGMYTS
jgi:glycosyltransferase involved in cell wall biosynthesis